MSKKFTTFSKRNGLESNYYGLSEEEEKFLEGFENISNHYESGTFEELRERYPELINNESAYKSVIDYMRELDKSSKKDLMSRGWGVDVDPTLDTFSPDFINELRGQAEFCGRCIKPEPECHCEELQRHSPYGPGDWRQEVLMDPEEAYSEYMDKHQKAFDLQPKGNAPPNLDSGSLVWVAIPKHSLNGKQATIVRLRPQDGKYEVLVESRGIRGFFSPNELSMMKVVK